MNKTGLVLKVENNIATLVTNSGEFVEVLAEKNTPKIGETYSGAIKKENNFIKYLAAVAAMLIIFIGGGGTAYAYYTPTATVLVSINPSIEIKINRFDKIIKVSPKNTDGETLLKSMELKNRNIDEALMLVVEQAKKDNFINENYIAEGKTISVKISAKDSNKSINIDKFEKVVDENKINTDIDNNGVKSKLEYSKNQESSDTDSNNSKGTSSAVTSDVKDKSDTTKAENSNKKDNNSKEQIKPPMKNENSNKNSTDSTSKAGNTENTNNEDSSKKESNKANNEQGSNKSANSSEKDNRTKGK